MNFKSQLNNYLDIVIKLIRYNLKIIFANNFVYFLLASVTFFIIATLVNLFSGSILSEGSIYYLLLFPGILIIFYPTTFGIQNDEDANMLEIIFGIPNYRYKVWVVRMALIYLVVAVILVFLGMVCALFLVGISVFEMVFQLLFPIFFLGSLAFMLSTITRNGNGTAVAMVIIGVVLWIASGSLQQSDLNLFLNPFSLPSDVNEAVWADLTVNNRLYLFAGMVLANLYGLLKLQKRELFI